MTNSYRPIDRLKVLIEAAGTSPYQRAYERGGARLPKASSNFQRLCHLSQALLQGALPDANTLEFVAVAIAKYERAQGAMSLDEAFGLKAKRSAGNPSAQHARELRYNNLLFQMALYRASYPRTTLTKAADLAVEDFPELVGDDDPTDLATTLVRYYSSRRCRVWEAGIRNFHESETKAP